jgi:multidrug efflux system outer membrane protein
MKRILYIILAIVLLHSCKIGKNYKGTEFNQPTSYAQQDPDASVVYDSINTDSISIDTASIRWWTMYNDPVLDTLIREAFANNRNAMIAAENVLQARYALNIQNADLLPKFDLQGQVNRGNFLLNQIGPTSNAIVGAAGVYWEIDLWGKLRRLSEAARADLMATEYGYRGIMISLVSEVAATYFDLLRAKSQYEIAQRNAKSRDSMTQIIIARYEKGIVPVIDVDQSTIQYTIAAGSVPQYERQIVQLENSLSILLGRNPGPVQTGETLEDRTYEMDMPIATPVELLARRPDVLAAEFGVIAQNARTGAAKGARLPTISLNGLVGVAGPNFNSLTLGNPLWSIGGQALAPLFYWGQLKRQVDIEDSRTFQALYQYQNTVFGAVAEVEDILVDIRTTKVEIEIANERRRAALEAQYLSMERYNKGVTSYLEFLEQQRQAFDAELLLEGLRARLLTSYVQLYKALGGGWLTEAEEQAATQASE